MSITGFIRGQIHRVARKWTQWRLSGQPPRSSLKVTEWEQSLKEPLGFYLDCYRFFHTKLPVQFRQHRKYFHNVPNNRRGFGEDAFHVMWYLLLEEFKPGAFLEIGVFRGQVTSLAALWAKLAGRPCQVHGISPFSPAGDSVSHYRGGIDYYQDTLANFEHFNLPHPALLRAYSTDEEAVKLILSKAWDCIYIDGNHDYDIVRQDWDVCSRSIKQGGLIVLDDAGLTTAYQPPVFASRGHPGPSRVAQEIDRSRFREILQVGHNRVFQRIDS